LLHDVAHGQEEHIRVVSGSGFGYARILKGVSPLRPSPKVDFDGKRIKKYKLQKKGERKMIYAYGEQVGSNVQVLARNEQPAVFSDLLKSGQQNGVIPRLLRGKDEEIFKLMSLEEVQRKGLFVEDALGEIRKWRESGLSRGPQMEAAVSQLIANGAIRP